MDYTLCDFDAHALVRLGLCRVEQVERVENADTQLKVHTNHEKV